MSPVSETSWVADSVPEPGTGVPPCSARGCGSPSLKNRITAWLLDARFLTVATMVTVVPYAKDSPLEPIISETEGPSVPASVSVGSRPASRAKQRSSAPRRLEIGLRPIVGDLRFCPRRLGRGISLSMGPPWTTAGYPAVMVFGPSGAARRRPARSLFIIADFARGGGSHSGRDPGRSGNAGRFGVAPAPGF